MIEPFNSAQELLKKQLNRSYQYMLQIDRLMISISIHTITGQKTLNKPWCYEIIFTSNNKQLTVDTILTQKARLTFQPKPPSSIIGATQHFNAAHLTLHVTRGDN